VYAKKWRQTSLQRAGRPKTVARNAREFRRAIGMTASATPAPIRMM
jgi:hypothetical protein